MTFILPDYIERRAWSEEFVEHIYQSTLETADHTRYVSVRAKNPDGALGDILVTIGLNRASYGTTRFFNQSTQAWEVHTGPYGSSYNEDYGRALPEKQHFDVAAWEGPVPLLGLEQYLDIRLPRPSVIEEISGPHSETRFNLPSYDRSEQKNPIVDPDLHQPIYFGSGEIYEPVRFWAAPESKLRGAAYEALIPQILQSLFPKHRGVLYGAMAQHLYTYNPRREGILLYGRRGFELMPQIVPKTLDGTTWYVMQASPATFAKKLSAAAVLGNDDTQQFVQSLRESTDELILKENSARLR